MVEGYAGKRHKKAKKIRERESKEKEVAKRNSNKEKPWTRSKGVWICYKKIRS